MFAKTLTKPGLPFSADERSLILWKSSYIQESTHLTVIPLA